jgi:hypothetical protein
MEERIGEAGRSREDIELNNCRVWMNRQIFPFFQDSSRVIKGAAYNGCTRAALGFEP